MFCQKCGNKLKNAEGACLHCSNPDRAPLENSYRREDLLARLFREDPAFSLIWGDQVPQPLPELQPQPQPASYSAARTATKSADSLTPPGRFPTQTAASPTSAPMAPAKKQPKPLAYLAAGAAGMLAVGIVLQLGISAIRGKPEETVKTVSVQTTTVEAVQEEILSTTEVVTEAPTEPELAQPGEILLASELEQYNRCDETESLVLGEKENIPDGNYGTQLYHMLNLVRGQTVLDTGMAENIAWHLNNSSFGELGVSLLDGGDPNYIYTFIEERGGYQGINLEGKLYFQRALLSDGTTVLLGLRGREDDATVLVQENPDSSFQWGNLALYYSGNNPNTVGKQYHLERTELGAVEESSDTQNQNASTESQQENFVTTTYDLYIEENYAALRTQSGDEEAKYSFYWITEGYAYPIEYVFRTVEAAPEETTTEAFGDWDGADTGITTTTVTESDMGTGYETTDENGVYNDYNNNAQEEAEPSDGDAYGVG